MALLMPFLFDALAIILEIRLAADEHIRQFLLLGHGAPRICSASAGLRGRAGDGLRRRFGRVVAALLRILVPIFPGLFVVGGHESRFSSESSEKNCAIKATAVITRS